MHRHGCDRLSHHRATMRHAGGVNLRIDLLLLDVDGVLLDYQRALRVRHLADALQVPAQRVGQVLFESGLESAYDRGAVATDTYLRRLGAGLQTAMDVDEMLWITARLVASRPRMDVVQRMLALPSSLPLAVLTNNGPLMKRVLPRALPLLHPRLEGRVLCSGMLGGRKPEPGVFLHALHQLKAEPSRTLFVDDLFVNVRGARKAGLHAETVRDGRSLGRVLKRYGLA